MLHFTALYTKLKLSVTFRP